MPTVAMATCDIPFFSTTLWVCVCLAAILPLPYPPYPPPYPPPPPIAFPPNPGNTWPVNVQCRDTEIETKTRYIMPTQNAGIRWVLGTNIQYTYIRHSTQRNFCIAQNCHICLKKLSV